MTQALNLPTICNLNPRSIYNKTDQFRTLVLQEEIDLIFVSESWERTNLSLENVLNMEDYSVISSVSQRNGLGGRPAIIANKRKFNVENVTNSLVQVPWGVEAAWSIVSPKLISQDSKIQKIACCSLYFKPGCRKKTLFLDHIADAFNILSKKYTRGLYFIISGDTNHLDLNPILNLSPNLQQIVKNWTRLDPPAILDPIITSLHTFYQKPECLPPLDVDSDKRGEKSDRRIVIARPINEIDNKSCRQFRHVKVRPINQSGIKKMEQWFKAQTFEPVYQAESAHEKAKLLQDILLTGLDNFFPEKIRKFSSDDQPWVSHKIKMLDRRRKRVFHLERKSERWKRLDKVFKSEVKKAKRNFYAKSITDLKQKNPGQWYSALKRMTAGDQLTEEVIVEEINHLDNQEQAESIADSFSAIPNLYEKLKHDDVIIPPFSEADVPEFRPADVWIKLVRQKTNKSCVAGDFPPKLSKIFAAYICEPLADVINTGIRRGEYPQIYKREISTPVPKVHPPGSISKLRNISGLLSFDKITEKLISEIIVNDMEKNIDPKQYGNQRGLSIQHYLIEMIHRILSTLDKTSKKETFAVIANLVDWNNAFPRQCPKLGVEAFLKCGVRPSLIPILVNYFQNRTMRVKWHGCSFN